MVPWPECLFSSPLLLKPSLKRKSRTPRLGREPWAALTPGVSRAPPAPSCSWGGRGPARHLSRLPGPPGEGAGPGKRRGLVAEGRGGPRGGAC